MKKRRISTSIIVVSLAFLFLLSIATVNSTAQKNIKSVKPVQSTIQRKSITVQLPDLAVDKVELNKDCYLIFRIRNKGPGSMPQNRFKDCIVQVRVGRNQENFYLGISSKRGKNPVDPKGILLKPGGIISYDTGIRVLEETKASVYVDSGSTVVETDERNNRSGTVVLKPNCSQAVASVSGATAKLSTRKAEQLDGTLQKKPERIPAGNKTVQPPAASMQAVLRISEAFDMMQGGRSVIVLQGQSFGNSPDNRSIRLVRSNSAGDPVMNYFLTIHSWSNDEIIADMPDSLANPSNPSERGTYLSERAGRFTTGLYSRNETRWLSNEIAVRPGTGRSVDYDGSSQSIRQFPETRTLQQTPSQSDKRVSSKVSVFLDKIKRADSLDDLKRSYNGIEFSKQEVDQLSDAIKESQYLNKLRDIAQRELSKPSALPGKQTLTVKKSNPKQSGIVTKSHVQQLQKIRNDMAVQKSRILKNKGDVLTDQPRTGTTGRTFSQAGKITTPKVSSGSTIHSVYPSRAQIGRDITISGAGFGDAQGRIALLFNGGSSRQENLVNCEDIVSWSGDRIIVTIPADAANAVSDRDTVASIWVKVAGGQTGPLHDITLIPDLSLLPPRIDHLSHPDIIPDQPLLIQGENFLSQREGEVFFRFAGKEFPAQISSWDDIYIWVQVPPIIGLLRTPGSVLVRNHAGYEATAVATFSPSIWSDEYWGPGNHGSTTDTRITVQCTPRFGELSYNTGDNLEWLLCVFGQTRENQVIKRLYNGWTVQRGYTELLDGNGWQDRYNCGAYYKQRQPDTGSEVIRIHRVVWTNAYSACTFRDRYFIEGPAGVSWHEDVYNPELACLDTSNRSDLDHLRRSLVSCNEVRRR